MNRSTTRVAKRTTNRSKAGRASCLPGPVGWSRLGQAGSTALPFRLTLVAALCPLLTNHLFAHHYCFATVQDRTIQFKAYDLEGRLFDTFELTKAADR